MKHEPFGKKNASNQGTEHIYSDKIETLFALQNSSVVLEFAQVLKQKKMKKLMESDK